MEIDSTYGQVVHLPTREVSVARETFPRPHVSLTDMLGVKPADPTATGFVLSLLPQTNGPILWVQDHASRRENGYLYTPSLAGFGIAHPVLQVCVSHPRDVLWAMEEGASCAGVSAVVGEIHGAPAALSFTATKRLAMRSDVSGVPIYLIRSGDPGVLSAARERWRVGGLPSQVHPHDPQSPGSPQWDVDLFRVRGRTPQRWVAQYDPDANTTADRVRLVPRSVDGPLDQGDKPIPDTSTG